MPHTCPALTTFCFSNPPVITELDVDDMLGWLQADEDEDCDEVCLAVGDPLNFGKHGFIFATPIPTPSPTPTATPSVLPTPTEYEATPTAYEGTPTPTAYEATPSAYFPTPTEYEATPSAYFPTPTEYEATPSEYLPTPTEYEATPSAYFPTPTEYEATFPPTPTPSAYEATPSAYLPTPTETCEPAFYDFILASPGSALYGQGDVITFSPVSVLGTPPFTYSWEVNDDPRSTSSSFVYTVDSSDFEPPDFTGWNVIRIRLTITNDCGSFSLEKVIHAV